MKRFLLSSALSLAALTAVQSTAQAQLMGLDDVAFNQKLDAPMAGELQFKDETGKTVKIGDLTNGKATLIMMGYYSCPMVCDPLLQNMVDALKSVKLEPGKDYNIVALSVDPEDTVELAAQKKKNLLERYGKPETADGWHWLTGSFESIDAFAKSVGYQYAKLPTVGYSHPAGLIVVTPKGHVSRYLIGMTFQPRDIRLALVESGEGKIGTFSDAVLLRCYHYDASTGKYGFAIQTTLKVTGCLTALGLFSSIAWMSYRYRQKPGVTP